MAITYPVPSGSTLPSRRAARQINATTELAFIAARYRVKPGQRERPAEMIFMKTASVPAGFFLPPYDVLSTRVGNLYTIVREGGWPKDLELHAQEEGSGVAPAALQPLPTGTVAAWSLEAEVGSRNMPGTDRSGNGRHFGAVNGYTGPDIIPGETAFLTASEESVASGPHGIQQNSYDAALRLQGEMSIMGRAAKSVYPPGPSGSFYQWIVSFGAFTGAAGAGGGNVAYSLVMTPGKTLQYFAQYSTSNTAVVYDSGLTFDDGRWHFLSLRRTAAGVVTIGVDNQFATSGALALPDLGFDGRMRLGMSPFASIGDITSDSYNKCWVGLLKDWVPVNRRLSDAEIAAQEAVAMGPYLVR